MSSRNNFQEDLDFNPAKINVFLDIAESDIIPKLTKYIHLNGGKSSPFLDISVTHVVTDKAKTMTEIYHMTQKWNLKVWTVEEFASHLLSYMYSKGTKVNSPTLLKLTTIKRDLSQCLQEEKRQSKPSKSTTTSNQFASTRTNESNLISFVPFEAFYVVIEDAEGLHCPIYKEYPVQYTKDESSVHFKVPRLPYPIFYWDSPLGQCPFIPPLLNDPSHHQAGRKSSQPPALQVNNNLSEKSKSIIATQDLRTRALRNSTAAAAAKVAGPPKYLFEPAMTDTSILTAKTNLNRQASAAAQHHRHPYHHHHHMHQNQQHQQGKPVLKITPNISVNVNRATVSAMTPKHVSVSGNLKKICVTNDENQPEAAVANVPPTAVPATKCKREKGATVQHRARPGFCECCCEKYSDLEKHVREPMHRQYALQSDNYEGIDNFLSGLRRPFKAEFLYFKSSSVASNALEDGNNTSFLLETSLNQNSPLSPTTTTSQITTTARNYTGTKKMKQSLASKRIKMIANVTTSSILDEEDAEAAGVVEVLSAATTNNKTAADVVNYISSPSCKRRKSFKLVQ